MPWYLVYTYLQYLFIIIYFCKTGQAVGELNNPYLINY